MKYRNWLFILGIFLAILVLVIFNTNNTYAYPYEINNSVLFYNDDLDILEDNIEKYLTNLDDLLIINSSYELSDVLIDNYDFLIYFAMDYIFDNYEYYSDRLIEKEMYYYVNREFESYNNNLYVSIDEIYNITDKYFGIRDFIIVNDNLIVSDGYVSLIDYTEDRFSLEIKDVEVSVNGDLVMASVYYDNDVSYLYTFFYENSVLKIRNIEVLV